MNPNGAKMRLGLGGTLALLFLLTAWPGWTAPFPPSPGPVEETRTLTVAGQPRQGNPLFVRVGGAAPGTRGSVHWAHRSFPMSQAGTDGLLQSVIPVPVDMPSGSQVLTVVLSTGGFLRRDIRVTARRYPLQRIQLPASTLATYDTARNRADDRRIEAALRQFEPARLWSGFFRLPCRAPYSRNFGLRRIYNGWRKGWHKGLDLRAAEGDAVRAPANGIVVLTAHGITNGNTIVLNHGLGLGSTYLHLSRIEVRVGQSVKQGDVIGRVGGTGGFAPHLHWEVRVHAIPVDPLSLLSLPAGWR